MMLEIMFHLLVSGVIRSCKSIEFFSILNRLRFARMSTNTSCFSHLGHLSFRARRGWLGHGCAGVTTSSNFVLRQHVACMVGRLKDAGDHRLLLLALPSQQIEAHVKLVSRKIEYSWYLTFMFFSNFEHTVGPWKHELKHSMLLFLLSQVPRQ